MPNHAGVSHPQLVARDGWIAAQMIPSLWLSNPQPQEPTIYCNDTVMSHKTSPNHWKISSKRSPVGGFTIIICTSPAVQLARNLVTPARSPHKYSPRGRGPPRSARSAGLPGRKGRESTKLGGARMLRKESFSP